MVDPQQIVIARYSYDPFGNILSKSGTLADANTYRFSSQEYHQPSGLSLYLYRAYDPNLQRWLNRDPIEEMGGANLYGYVGNNPIMRVDPVGLDWTDYIPNWVGGLVSYTGPTYSPALPKPDGILTPLSGGRENLFSDFKNDVHHVGNEVGKELAVGGAMMLIPEEEILGLVGEGLAKLKALRACKSVAKEGIGAARDAIALAEKIKASGMTTRQAGEFFGWGTGPQITKPLSAFSRESLEAAGWTKETLSAVANAYREISNITPNNAAAPVRAQQIEALLELFQ
jgi:RHS repeat-associated protein